MGQEPKKGRSIPASVLSQELLGKVEMVNEILLDNEPGNISYDKYSGFTGYEPQSVIDAMNEVFGIDSWGFEDIYNKRFPNSDEVVAKVEVFILADGEKFTRSAYGVKQNTKRKSGDGWNMSWGDCKKSAQTDALKKALSYFSVGNRAYHGLLLAPNVQTNSTQPRKAKRSAEITKPWLNSPKIERAKAELDAGNVTIDQIKKRYRISKVNEEYLLGKRDKPHDQIK